MITPATPLPTRSLRRGLVRTAVVGLALAASSLPISRVGAAEPVTPDATSSPDTSAARVSALIVERLPGRSSKAAREHVARSVEVIVTPNRMLGDGYETIDLQESLSWDDALRLAAELVDRGLVASAEPAAVRRPLAVPNDPNFADQWYLQAPTTNNQGIDIVSAWNLSQGASDIVVAVIDTGRLDHPDLAGRFADGYDFVSRPLNSKDGDGWDGDETDLGDWSDSSDPVYTCGRPFQASTWHATHVAGIVGANANNALGVAGVDQRARVQHIRILGTCGGQTSDEAAAIRWAAGLPVPGVPSNATPARVINLSLGSEAPCQAVEQDAIDAATAAGAIVVVAAGNSNRDLDISDFAPANCNNVITVAAVQSNGARAPYSNYGSSVDLAAPGGPSGLLSLQNGGLRSADPNSWTYGYKQGTSMATPVVSGVVSLLLSIDPELTPAEVRSILQTTARPFATGVSSPCSSNPSDTFHCGAGVVDPAAALRLVATQNGGTTPSTRLGSTGDQYTTNLAVEALVDRTDVILVSGSKYPDGLSAAALAKQENADILLVPPTGLGTAQIQAIVAENPQTVWIVGGPQAVPSSVETQLSTSVSQGGAGVEATRIQRVFGATRFDTAVEVSKRIQTVAFLGAKPTAIVVRGDSFADAVIAGPATFGITGGIGSHPVFLVNRDTIPASVVEQLKARGITNVLVIGGTSVVSETVRLGIQSLGITVTRIAGADRYATAAALGQLLITPIPSGGFGWNAGDVGLVDVSDTSLGFDAISAVGLLGPTRRMMLGVTPLRLPSATASYLTTLRDLTTRLTVIGSATAIPDSVISEAKLALA